MKNPEILKRFSKCWASVFRACRNFIHVNTTIERSFIARKFYFYDFSLPVLVFILYSCLLGLLRNVRLSAIDKYVSVAAAPARSVGRSVCFTLPGMLYRKIAIDKVDLRKFSPPESTDFVDITTKITHSLNFFHHPTFWPVFFFTINV